MSDKVKKNIDVASLADTVIAGRSITPDQALSLLHLQGQQCNELFLWANQIRIQCLGPEISLCAIASARTANCPEDCRFCAQSTRYQTNVQPNTADPADLLQAADSAAQLGVNSFGLVTSGKTPTDKEIDRLAETIREISRRHNLQCCASLGCLDERQARRLYQLGVRRYNHNLETSRRFFPSIVSTHSYDDRIKTVQVAKQAGLKVCCGGIFGLGETLQDRVELAFTLRELEVDTVPVNFLNPIPGTPLADRPLLKPMEALQIIAMLRFVLPDKQIKVAGGREVTLRDLQSWMFFAGASSTMVGNYLTTQGRRAEDDFQMLADLELDQPG